MRRSEIIKDNANAVALAVAIVKDAQIKRPTGNILTTSLSDIQDWKNYITGSESYKAREESQIANDRLEIWSSPTRNPWRSNDNPVIKEDLRNPATWHDPGITATLGHAVQDTISDATRNVKEVTDPIAGAVTTAASGVGAMVQGLVNVPSKIIGGLDNFMTILAIGAVGIGGLIIYGEYKNITK